MAAIIALKNPAAAAAPLDRYDPGPYYCELTGSPDQPQPAPFGPAATASAA